MKYGLDKLRLIHLFSGVGAPEMALKKLGIPLEIIGFSEIDKYAIQSYKSIHGDVPSLGDVSKIDLLPECDLVVYGSPCLTGDTLVEVANNKYITIKKLASYGTENRFNVLAVDTSQENKRTIVLAEGYNCHMTKRVDTLIKIKRGRSCFKCTPEHKILLPNCEWVEAKELKDGDYIWGNASTPITVEILHVDNEPVYDLTVPNHHNFIIKGNFCVHNCQDFSCAGRQKGLIDEEGNQTRSGLLFEVERLMENAKCNGTQPKFLLMENVKNLVGKQFKPDFDRWLERLEELGYNNYWEVLNAKDYGVPQNRERVFVVSILRELDENGYIFPKKIKSNIRLKDVLLSMVDDKYYLGDTIVERFKKQIKGDNIIGTTAPDFRTIGQRDIVYSVNGCIGALVATDYKQPKQIGIPTESDDKDEEKIVCEQRCDEGLRFFKDDVCGTLRTVDACGDKRVIEYPCTGASRGRNPENPSDRTVGAPTEQRLELNSNGVSNTLTTVQKDNLVVEMFNPYNNSKIEDVVPCQTTACGVTTSSASVLVVESAPIKIGNIYGEDKGTGFAGNVYDNNGISPTLMTMSGGNSQPMVLIDHVEPFEDTQIGTESTEKNKFLKNKNVDLDVYREMVLENKYELPIAVDEQNVTVRKDDTVGTLTTDGSSPKKNNRIMEQDFRIRKLTPLECWRLMGFSDEDFYTAKLGAREVAKEILEKYPHDGKRRFSEVERISKMSDTQLYKQAGNSIVVDVLQHIFRMLFVEEYEGIKKHKRNKLLDWKPTKRGI